MNWRYVSCPDREYSIFTAEENGILAGFIVLTCGDENKRQGHIIDCLLLPEMQTASSLLIYNSIDYLKNQGMEMAVCHLFEHSPFHNLFTESGFFKYGESFPFLVHPLTNYPLYSSILDFEQWHLMEGDIDIF